MAKPLVGIIMGSKTDLDVLEGATGILKEFGVEHEVRVLSAHRTPEQVLEWSATAESRGLEVLIAGAGGAAHLPGMAAAKTLLPVLGVPMPSRHMSGLDSLASIVQMPAGIPVGTLAIGQAGAINAALLATAILARSHGELRSVLERFRREQTDAVLARPDPRTA
jgi:5-(carboxyamino)imidazole ribonucleotide mutase